HEGVAVPALTAHLEDEDEKTRRWALDVLGVYGPMARPAGLKILGIAAKDASLDCRIVAIDALQRIKPDVKTVLPVLRQALKDESLEVRAVGIRYLQQLGPAAKEAVPDLVAALKTASDEPERPV